ncbi:MAG: RimK family alpha-L-glutamate ligase, partial [Pseudolabrys sp.]
MTDKNDWHARTLGKAFAALGAQILLLKLPACGFDTATTHGLCLPDFELGLPDAVLVRDMAGGTFQAVTLRLGFLHALQ